MEMISNPAGAFSNVLTFVSGVNEFNGEIEYGKNFRSYRVGTAVVRGQALSFVAPTATVPITVAPMGTAINARLFAGIALESAAIGQFVRTANQGHCLLFVNAQTVAAGDTVSVPAVNAGEASCAAADPDATTIVGRTLGVIFGIKASTAGANLAPAYLNQV